MNMSSVIDRCARLFERRTVLVLLFVSFLPLLTLLTPGLPKTHDGQDHVARIANFYQSLFEGNLIPRWGANLNWGYGHPVLMFLYPLPSYAASFFHALGLTFTDSVKLVFAVAYVLSVLGMYGWLKRHLDTHVAAVGAILYGFAPYRFVNLYVRGALGEHMAFVFLPLTLWCMAVLSQNKGRALLWVTLLGLSIAGLVLSHNAVTVMFVPVALAYCFYLLKSKRQGRFSFVVCVGSGCVLGALISAFFWVPAFFEGKFTLRDIVTAGEYVTRFVSPLDFFTTTWSFGGTSLLSKSLGWPIWAGILMFVIVYQKLSVTLRALGIGAVTLYVASLFVMTSYSAPIWQQVSILQKFQFPWRFLVIATFAGSVVASLFLAGHAKKILVRVAVVYAVLTVIMSVPMWNITGTVEKPDSFYSDIYKGTTDTGESSPIWSVRFMERRPDVKTAVVSGEATITETYRSTTERRYRITVPDNARIVENTLYFPGWRVYVDGVQAGIEFQDPAYRGLITYFVDEGDNEVLIRFESTKLRWWSDLVSGVGLLATGGLLGYELLLRRKALL